MTWLPDMSPFPSGLWGDVRAIGWLGAGHPYPQGSASPEFLSRLNRFRGLVEECARTLHLAGGLGYHTCEFCPEPTTDGPIITGVMGHGHIGVPHGRILYVTPQMLPHYVAKHAYAPPVEFIHAVMDSPLPGTEAYLAAVQPFLRPPLVAKPPPPLLERIRGDLKQAMKARDALRVSVLRHVISEASIHHAATGLELPQSDQNMRHGVATRIEAIADFRRGGRLDLAEKEAREVEILREYLAVQAEPGAGPDRGRE